MARPIDANAEATQSRILAAASRLFADRDLGGASFRDIASAAGVSIGTVHHYFGGKDALHQACIDAMYADLAGLEAMLWPALGQISTREVLRTVVHEGFSFACAHRQSLILLMREVIRRGELDEHRRESQHRPFLENASKLLADRTGATPERCRLTLQSAIHLVVRYALASERDLLMFAGADEEDVAEPDALLAAASAIEAQIVRFIAAELGIGMGAHA